MTVQRETVQTCRRQLQRFAGHSEEERTLVLPETAGADLRGSFPGVFLPCVQDGAAYPG